MVKVKGVEWNHVLVVKEPERHGMATLVRCAHCGKEFQGNAMRIRAHLLGNKRSAGVSGCPSCPEDAREELRIIDIAKSQVKRKRQDRTPRVPRATSSSDHSLDSAMQQMDFMTALQKGEKSAVEQALRSMVFQGGLPVNFVNFSPVKSAAPSLTEAADLESFFDGFGIRPETIGKIKEMGFTGKTFMSNVDELLTLLDSIKQHCHLTLGEEWGIKGAAKKWQKDHSMVFNQPELEKWPETDNETANGCKELSCLRKRHYPVLRVTFHVLFVF
uniref:Floricaula/leafy-like transcription factor n=1 Tax=Physcomitrium patens TaxID=3218 RepID=A0A7I4DHE8_PHYPA